MKKLALLLLLIPMIAFATIYSYTAKDGKIYYTNEKPTGLTTAEKAQYKTVYAGTVDTMTKTAPLPLSNRDAVKKIMKADNAPVIPPVVVPPPQPPVVQPSNVFKPSSARLCAWEGQNCPIPSGVTARVYFGLGQYWVYKDNVTGSIACTKAGIGDPLIKTAKNPPECHYLNKTELEPVLDPKGQNLMPYVNASLTPKGSAGFSVPMIKSAPIPPDAPGTAGAFRIGCEYSHGNFDDPIVWPGLVGASHHHTFFGNTSITANSTSAGILKEGNSTCAGGILNRSGYWMPSLINTSNGAPQKPSVVVVYYKASDEKTGATIQPPPVGLRMIAGNARPLAIADAQGGFFCQDQTRVLDDQNGIVWQGSSIKASCGGSNNMLRMIVNFPSCWDGKNLDSPDHKSHMANTCGDNCKDANNNIVSTPNACPLSHPVQIPNITINADFYNLDPNAKYRLSSDNYSTTYNGGYSLHADWMNGWDEGTITRVVKNCLNNPKNCGGPNLGDGQTLYGVNQD